MASTIIVLFSCHKNGCQQSNLSLISFQTKSKLVVKMYFEALLRSNLLHMFILVQLNIYSFALSLITVHCTHEPPCGRCFLCVDLKARCDILHTCIFKLLATRVHCHMVNTLLGNTSTLYTENPSNDTGMLNVTLSGNTSDHWRLPSEEYWR